MSLDLLSTLLFVPGNQPARFEKALGSGAEGVILDLEDAVSPQEKDTARREVFQWLRSSAVAGQARRGPLRAVRINPRQGPYFEADDAALCEALASGLGPDLIVVPKVDSPEDIVACVQAWRRHVRPLPPLMALIETAAGLEAVARIARVPEVAGLGFGAADLSADLGCDMSWEALAYARGRVAHAAALGGVALLDVPHLDLNDEDGLRSQALRAKAMGFTGKLAIHPRQVAPIVECFTPNADQIAQARRIVEAADRSQGQVCVVDGRMVDEPVVRSARKTLARAAARS